MLVQHSANATKRVDLTACSTLTASICVRPVDWRRQFTAARERRITAVLPRRQG